MNWISIKEQKPTENGRYLVNVLHEHAESRPFEASYITKYYASCCCGQMGFHYTSNMALADYKITITHWMPLPSLPVGK